MLEIIDITEMRIHVTHDDNNSLGKPVSFVTVGNCADIFNHLLYIPAILGKDQPGAAGIIIVFHKTIFGKAK